MMSCRASTRILGNCRENHHAPITEAKPPIATVSPAPRRSDSAPPKREPTGAIPMNIIEYKAMVRPRSVSGTITWIRVFDEDICSMMKYPTGSSSSTDSQKDFEKENSIRLMPKPAQHTET